MNIQEIIEQRKAANVAKANMKAEKLRNKAEILVPVVQTVFEFFEIIRNDPAFLFTTSAHPKKGTGNPLGGTERSWNYKKENALKEAKEKAFHRTLLGSFGFGANNGQWVIFNVNDDFEPIISFGSGGISSLEEFTSTEEAIAAMTDFFIKKSNA